MLETVYTIIGASLLLCCTLTHFKQRSLKATVHTDFLTGLYNRKIMHQIEANEKNGIKYLVIACDIDHFKSVNDTYGHSTGDLVLKTVAETIKHMFKSNVDYVIRFGGEEFFVLMKENEEAKKIIFERTDSLRKKIEGLNILTEDMKLIKITASFGICIDLHMSLDERLKDSDKKLYQAKHAGRNIVIL